MNKEILKEIMSNMYVVKELDEYAKNKLATLMERLFIEIRGKERYEYLLENPKDKANGSSKSKKREISLKLPSSKISTI